jgi:hypothetical protein
VNYRFQSPNWQNRFNGKFNNRGVSFHGEHKPRETSFSSNYRGQSQSPVRHSQIFTNSKMSYRPVSLSPASPRKENSSVSSFHKTGTIFPTHPYNKRVTCFYCNQPGHIRPQCHKYLKDKEEGIVSFVGETNNGGRRSFTSTGSVNGKIIQILRDTGADVTVVREDLLENPQWVNKELKVTSAFSKQHVLKVANVYLTSIFGKGFVEVGVSPHLSVPCLLGNETYNKWQELHVQAVKTRSRALLEPIVEEDEPTPTLTSIEIPTESSVFEAESSIELPLPDVRTPELTLLEITPEEFKKLQNEDKIIQGLVAHASPEYVVKEGLVYRCTKSVKLISDTIIKKPRKLRGKVPKEPM